MTHIAITHIVMMHMAISYCHDVYRQGESYFDTCSLCTLCNIAYFRHPIRFILNLVGVL